MQIAILGAGFSGLSVCYHLLKYKRHPIEICLFDPCGIGGGASGASSGLLHPYAGLHARRTRNALEGMRDTINLIQISEDAYGDKVAQQSGILRPAQTDAQLQDFFKASQEYDDIEWWNGTTCNQFIPGISCQAGIFISTGLTVNSPKYLNGLWLACQALGARLIERRVSSLEELDDFDCIIVATGASTLQLPELSSLPLIPIKGQIIELSWPSNMAPLPCSLVSKCYIFMSQSLKSCIVGATYERNFTSALPDSLIATKELHGKIIELLPNLSESSVIDCRAGIRIFSPDNLTPVVGKLTSRIKPTWVFTALGSKGLIYHAWLGKLLAEAILTNSPELLPIEVRCRLA